MDDPLCMAAAKPASTSRPMRDTSASGTQPSAIISLSACPPTCSMTKKSMPSEVSKSWMVAMWGD
jgi:hypothetical protein